MYMKTRKRTGIVSPLLTPRPPTWGYAEVERSLAAVYEAEGVQQTAFRARLKHFRKLKIPQSSPGKGQRLRYSASDIFQLMIALELTEFGIAPELIAKLIRSHWEGKRHFWQAIMLAQSFPGDDFFIALPARFMSWTWSEKFKQSDDEISYESGMRDPIYVTSFKASDVDVFLKDLNRGGERMMVFNLSARIRAISDALTTWEICNERS
jgi:hypothetical protein